MPDFIYQGQVHGSVGERLLAAKFDPNVLRPYLVGEEGRERSFITNVKGGKATAVPSMNAATLRKDDWKILDEAIIRVAKPRLRAFGDLRAANSFTIPQGMGKTVLEYEDVSDITPATISMDGLRRSESDRPVFDLKTLPLPIVHKDFHFSARQLEASRNGGSPLDTTTAELAARRVAEEVEKLTLGVRDTYTYGGGTIYGYSNFPNSITGSLTAPTGSNGNVTVQEVLQMRQASRNKFYYGPWVLYNSPAWDQYLDDDYSDSKGDNTLRERIQRIDGISAVRTLDYLEGYQFIMVQMTSDVARAVVGMEMTTLQWETHGGMEFNFKVMAILVPQLRTDQNLNTGIVHYQVA